MKRSHTHALQVSRATALKAKLAIITRQSSALGSIMGSDKFTHNPSFALQYLLVNVEIPSVGCRGQMSFELMLAQIFAVQANITLSANLASFLHYWSRFLLSVQEKHTVIYIIEYFVSAVSLWCVCIIVKNGGVDVITMA